MRSLLSSLWGVPVLMFGIGGLLFGGMALLTTAETREAWVLGALPAAVLVCVVFVADAAVKLLVRMLYPSAPRQPFSPRLLALPLALAIPLPLFLGDGWGLAF
jgi:hypothetical protein